MGAERGLVRSLESSEHQVKKGQMVERKRID